MGKPEPRQKNRHGQQERDEDDHPQKLHEVYVVDPPDLPRGEPRGFAREGFWLGKVLIFHTEVFRVVLTDKPLWDRYLLRSQPSKPLTGQLRADGTLRGSIRSLFQEPGAKSNALLW